MPVFDKKLVDVLKNFQTINNKIIVEPGDVIKVISPALNVFAKTKIPFQIPIEFCLYDLNQFLQILSIDLSRNVEFRDKYIELIGQYSSIKYHYAEPEVIDASTLKNKSLDFKLPSCEASFKISSNILKQTLGHCRLLNQKEVRLSYKDDVLAIKSYSQYTGNVNEFSHTLEMGNKSTTEFQIILSVDVLDLYKSDYICNVSKSKFIEFIGTDVEYIIASRPEHSYVK